MSLDLTKLAGRVPTSSYRRPPAPAPDALRLDSNEGSVPPAGMCSSLLPPALREYPDASDLQASVADLYGLSPNQVALTCGADDALDRLCRSFLERGRSLVAPVPTFAMLPRFIELAGGQLRPVTWERAFPVDELIDRIDETVAAVAIVSPNNPTGRAISREDLERIAAAAPNIPVIFDHVYADYADEDLTKVAVRYDNVIVVRTFSKAWGLASCRVGYTLSSANVANLIRNAGNPYPLSLHSIATIRAAIARGRAYVDSHVRAVRSEREEIEQFLQSSGIDVQPSQANFVYVAPGKRASFLRKALAGFGVVVRHFPERRDTETGVRISMPGSTEAFTRLRWALLRTLTPQAILFDLDGVIADVSRSYRMCVLETARGFGVELTENDYLTAKFEGDANNDWVLTRRLMAERGVDVPLATVVKRYQGTYLGSPKRAGLRDRETLLVQPEVLRDLSSHSRLALVTGRPREEAEWFLDRFGIRSLFSSLVCMEDAPAKPDPAPVRLALENLGVQSAWMIGDTPDDVRAALRADVVPLAVVSPGTEQAIARSALESAGAASILESIEELKELLP